MFEVSELTKAVILGIVQGATEFIPVSSSGHLVIIPWLLGWGPSTLLFDTMVHWGTLVAILIIFGRDFIDMLMAALGSLRDRSLQNPNARLAWLIVLATIPAALIGFLFEERIEGIFSSSSAPLVSGFSLLVTAGLLAGSEWLTTRAAQRSAQLHGLDRLSVLDAILIGVAQMVAILPGVSRSGSTIATGLTRGLRRDDAARFSFLLGTPVFFGAGLLQLLKSLTENSVAFAAQLPILVIGFLVSTITGYLAIRFLLAYLRTNNLYIFAIYCLVVGIVVITIALF